MDPDALERTQRCFRRAQERMQRAEGDLVLAEDELTVVLDQLYRLHELARKCLGDEPLREALRKGAGRVVAALRWARGKDVHHLVRWAQPVGGYGDKYTDAYPPAAHLAWATRPGEWTSRYGEHELYDELLEGQPVAEKTAAAAAFLLAVAQAR